MAYIPILQLANSLSRKCAANTSAHSELAYQKKQNFPRGLFW